MEAPDGRGVLVYNGELYNDAELRQELEPFAAQFGGFDTQCDAETVLFALMRWGEHALPRLRGIFALGWVDLRQRRALLARDPLGVKPLYWSVFGGELVFASEVATLIEHPAAHLEPDLEMIGAYLTTVRRELGDRTMFEGIRSVLPGEALAVDLDSAARHPTVVQRWSPSAVAEDPGEHEASAYAQAVMADSVARQLVSDRRVCTLLSGGFDSTVLVRLVMDASGKAPRTYCAGGVEGTQELGPDPAAARHVAQRFGTHHVTTPVDRETFVREWQAHVAHLGTPLSTPNEVAISEVARQLRAQGHAVALSGEGADELFAGYADVLDAYCAGGLGDPIAIHLGAATWVDAAGKAALLAEPWLSRADGTQLLTSRYTDAFARGTKDAGEHGTTLDAHVRLQREFNLTALLQRLDTATMRHGVEGRTPYADQVVARLAESLPMPRKYRAPDAESSPGAARSKIVLRQAFAGRIPSLALERPKASFPLPFQRWGAQIAAELPRSKFARTLFQPESLQLIAAQPETYWRFAWPVANLAMWGDRFWG